MNVSVNGEEWAREWFPELADSRLRQVTWPAIGEHRDYIVGQLAANLLEEVRLSQVRVLRLEPAEPGQEAQIDY